MYNHADEKKITKPAIQVIPKLGELLKSKNVVYMPNKSSDGFLHFSFLNDVIAIKCIMKSQMLLFIVVSFLLIYVYIIYICSLLFNVIQSPR